MSFASQLEKACSERIKKLNDISINATVLMFSAVLFETPVETGLLRANWIPTVGSPSGGISTALDPTGEMTIERIKSTVQPGVVNYLTNNLVYAPVVEYGLYPHPVKKQTGRSQGGFSTQAPYGMISPNILKWPRLFDLAVRMAR